MANPKLEEALLQTTCETLVIYSFAPELLQLIDFKHADAWLVLPASAAPSVRELENCVVFPGAGTRSAGFPALSLRTAYGAGVFFVFFPASGANSPFQSLHPMGL